MPHRYLAAVALLTALLLPVGAGAQGSGYNHVEAGFSRVEADNDMTIDGVYLNGSWLVESGSAIEVLIGRSARSLYVL